MKKTLLAVLAACLLLVGVVGMANASPVFFGPTTYLSSTDIPVGFYSGGNPLALEDFEDGLLSFGITASAGRVIPPYSPTGYIDSVGSTGGVGGHSWFYENGSTGVTFTFSAPVTAAGLVWTDGLNPLYFEAFRGAASLGHIGPVSGIADGTYAGTTGEDRFFGIQDLDGITSIKIKSGNSGIEIDHLQYGAAPVPEPGTMVLLGFGMIGLAVYGKRRMNKEA